MITGQNPDPNYDYQLEARIPGLTDTLNQLIAQCAVVHGHHQPHIRRYHAEPVQPVQPAARADAQELVRDVYYIPTRIEDLNNVLSVYGDNLSSLKEQALTLDYIELLPTEAVPTSRRAASGAGSRAESSTSSTALPATITRSASPPAIWR